MIKNYLFILILFLGSNISAQTSIGSWTDYFSYYYVIDVTASDENFYAATDMGIFSVDREYFNITKLSKVNGLSDVGISNIEYYDEYESLIIVYNNGNIDIIKNNEIFNIPDIKLKQLSGNTQTYSMTFIDNFVYLATGFGIVKVNIDDLEIDETYILGDNSEKIDVFQLSYDDNYFYAATENGILKAEIDEPFLIDYRKWTKITDIPNYQAKFNGFVLVDNEIKIVYYYNEETNLNELQVKNDDWIMIKNDFQSDNKFFLFDDKFSIIAYAKIKVYDFQGINIKNYDTYNYSEEIFLPRCIYFYDNDLALLGDINLSMNVEIKHKEFDNYTPNSPRHNEAFNLCFSDNTMYVVGGGKKNSTEENLWKKGRLFVYKDKIWENFEYDEGRDFVSITADPLNKNKVFVGSWGKGVFEIENNEIINIYNQQNSTLTSVIENPEYIRISDMFFDEDNNLWTINAAKNPINIKTTENQWISYDFDEEISYLRTDELILTKNNQAWAVLRNKKGIFVLDYNYTIEDINDDEYKQFYPKDEKGESIGGDVNSIAEDLEGNIWIGTTDGVGVVFNPQDFNSPDFYVSRILLTAELVDTVLTNHLLKGKNVTAIAVDGANRKWFGTERNGVFLMSETGSKEILHFDIENSPLPSNNILAMEINHKTGEIVFITDIGIASYQAEATKGNEEFEDVYVFPNPVRENYDGIITVTGLVDNVNVKITDIAGNLVFETDALGGRAIWDGRNFDGKRVSTGVYLIFSSNEDGTKTNVTKLLFIN